MFPWRSGLIQTTPLILLLVVQILLLAAVAFERIKIPSIGELFFLPIGCQWSVAEQLAVLFMSTVLSGSFMSSPENKPGFDRRTFIATTSSLGVMTAVGSSPALAETTPSIQQAGTKITLSVNRAKHQVIIDPRTSLLDCLRETLQLTGTKKGCDHGQCGACTVHVDGRRVNSCLCLAIAQQGSEITTIEGLGTPERLHPMQEAFIACDAYQCGYCTSGQIMSAVAMLQEPVGKTDDAHREALSGNICRCGAYPNILAAVRQVRDKT